MRLRWVLPTLACCLLLAGCARRMEMPGERGLTLVEEKAYTFSDGVSVDRWRDDWDGDRYCLSDGADLLWVRAPMGPENVVVIGQESMDSLNGTARAAVLAWFQERGLLYDVEQELERAYDLYLRCRETGKPYQEGMVEQTISPGGSNGDIACFVTSLTLPLDEPQMAEQIMLETIFDRETGQVISGWDLFTIPEAEVRAWAAEHAAGDDPVLRKEMEAALEPEWIILSPEGLSVEFPRGRCPARRPRVGGSRSTKKPLGLCSSPGPSRMVWRTDFCRFVCGLPRHEERLGSVHISPNAGLSGRFLPCIRRKSASKSVHLHYIGKFGKNLDKSAVSCILTITNAMMKPAL